MPPPKDPALHEEYRKHMGEIIKSKWDNDPDFRERNRQAKVIAMADPSVREKTKKPKTLSEEQRKKIAERISTINKTRKGQNQSETTIQKIKEKAIERSKDPAFREKLSIAAKKSHNDPEYKQKQSERFKKLWKDIIFREKMSNTNRGKKLSKETKQKISIAGKGRTVSEETKKKMSDSRKGYHPPKDTIEKLKEFARSPIGKEIRSKNGLRNIGKKASYDTIQKNREKKSGERSHFWKGGKSFEPYCPKFNKEFKNRVRAYFNYICPECLTPQNGTKLHVHHINFDKMSCCNETPPLFISLCQSCHLKTHFNKEYWEDYYTNMINGYYEGRCYFSKEEMISLNK